MVAPKRNDVIFDYTIIEAGCSDDLGVCIKGVQINEGLLYQISMRNTNFQLLSE